MDLSMMRARIAEMRLLRILPENLRLRFVMVILGIGREVTARNGQRLFQQGDRNNDGAYILLDGEAEILKEEAPPVIAQAPDLFGEIQQINPSGMRTATVVTKGDAHLLYFTWTAFFDAALTVFNEQELAALRRAFEELAWSHVTQ